MTSTVRASHLISVSYTHLIVSDIHGTTRDVIEDTVNLRGITCRFIDNIAPAICRAMTVCPSGVSITTIERSFCVLALGSHAFINLDVYKRQGLSSYTI